MARFRWTILPTRTRHGPWRDDPLQPREDALEAGLASRDENSGAIFLDELVEIQSDLLQTQK